MQRITIKKKFDTKDKNHLIWGDIIDILKSIPDHSVDHCITDPPYNISGYDNKKKIGWLKSNKYWSEDKSFSKIDEKWDKFSNADYLLFTTAWLSEIIRIIKPNGHIIIFGSYHNIYQIGALLQEFDRKIINSVTWFKRNAFPNVTQRMLCESTEHIIWAVNESTKKAKNWTFNYKALKEINGGVQMRNMWDIPMTPSSEKKFGKHPSQKPIAVISRLVIGASMKGDVILDPFMGSGTLPLVADMLGRKFIGIDSDKKYCELAAKRINFQPKNIF